MCAASSFSLRRYCKKFDDLSRARTHTHTQRERERESVTLSLRLLLLLLLPERNPTIDRSIEMRFFMESSFFLSKLTKKRYAFLHLLLFFIGIFRVICDKTEEDFTLFPIHGKGRRRRRRGESDMTNHHSLLAGEWKLEAICGHVRGKLWWHVAARGKKNPKGTNTKKTVLES